MWHSTQHIFLLSLFIRSRVPVLLGWGVETVSLPVLPCFFLSNLMKLQLEESKWDSISLWDLATELFTVLQSVMFKVELLTALLNKGILQKQKGCIAGKFSV